METHLTKAILVLLMAIAAVPSLAQQTSTVSFIYDADGNPIRLPDGINGVQPSLAISYNSQSGNGLLGWGWNLCGLSAITRIGQTLYHDGCTDGVNFVDYRFALDGQRLMLVNGRESATLFSRNKSLACPPFSDRYTVMDITDGLGNRISFHYDYLMPNHSFMISPTTTLTLGMDVLPLPFL